MKTKLRKAKFYNRLSLITLIALYLLILAGGIVRSTGSGMGCPDWPKCFGTWVPPTSANQLPADYQETYALQRVAKNHRLADYLQALGFNDTAEALRAEQLAAPEAAFNVGKTWTEYINRLIGVLVGLLIMGTLGASFRFIKSRPAIFYGSLAAFLLVVFQGWLGSVVVSTNLLPGVVTVHMVLALVILCLMIYLVFISSQDHVTGSIDRGRLIKILLVASMIAMVLQIALGTQVREAIDLIALQFDFLMRERWVENLGSTFYIHRSFSLLILAANVYLFMLLRTTILKHWARMLLALLVLEIAVGAYMIYFAIPAWAQPIHLLSSTLILGVQFWLYMKVKNLQAS